MFCLFKLSLNGHSSSQTFLKPCSCKLRGTVFSKSMPTINFVVIKLSFIDHCSNPLYLSGYLACRNLGWNLYDLPDLIRCRERHVFVNICSQWLRNPELHFGSLWSLTWPTEYDMITTWDEIELIRQLADRVY